MLHEGDSYSQQIYASLTEEREARLQVQSLLAQKSAECEEIEQRLANVRRSVGPVEERGRLAQAERAKAEGELVRTRAAVATLTAALTAERESLHTASKRLAESERENAELSKGRDALSAELAEALQKLTASDDLAGRFKARLALEKLRNAKLTQQLDESVSGQRSAEEAHSDLEGRHSELELAHSEVQSEREELQGRAEGAETRVEDLDTRCSVLEKVYSLSALSPPLFSLTDTLRPPLSVSVRLSRSCQQRTRRGLECSKSWI